ncbi:MAG: hypothetical protein Q4P33_08495 [Flaviflexus sp.]|nr:hypothetical protein [Flaviflexus sp.]
MTVFALLLAALALALPPERRLSGRVRVRIPRPRIRFPVSRRRDIDLGVLAAEVATRLSAGAGVEAAWQAALGRAGLPEVYPVLEDGCPRVLVSLDEPRSWLRRATDLLSGAPRISHLTRVALPSLLAAARLTWHTGAPMAHVLDECAEGLTEAGQAQAARQIALAGPKSTARLLAWLPLLGVGLGLLVGADPLGFFLGHPLGRLVLLFGLAFEAAGLLWVRHLVHLAEIDGALGSGP